MTRARRALEARFGGAARPLAAAAYLGFARHLPWSPRPGGAVARRLRAVLARHMLDACGVDVNVEHGAWFGSGKGLRLGDRSGVGMDCLLVGPVHIGRDVMMGPRCVLLATSHEFDDLDVPMSEQGFRPDAPIVVGDGAWLGASVVVLPGRRIGRDSIVGAGAVVAHDVPDRAVVAGNPAHVVRWRTPDGLPPSDQATSAG